MTEVSEPAVDDRDGPPQKSYGWWLASDSFAISGYSLTNFILPVLAFVLTGSAAFGGLVRTVEAVLVPVMLICGGIVIDRCDRSLLISLGGLFNCAVLAFAAAAWWLGEPAGWVLLLTAALLGLSNGLLGGASDAALKSVVSQKRYPQAIAVNEGRDAAIRLGAGPVGGWMMSALGGVSLAVAAAMHALSALAIRRVPTPLAPGRTSSSGVRADLVEAVSWLKETQRAITLGVLIGVANFGVAGVMLVTQFQVLDRGGTPLEVGVITAGAGVSVIAGAIIAGVIVPHIKTGVLIAIGFGWTTVGVCLLAIFNETSALVPVLCLTFLAVPCINSSLAGYFFASVPVELQGRVQSLVGAGATGIGALAPLAGGSLFESFGPTIAYAFSVGVMAIAFCVASGSIRIRQIPKPAEWASLPL